MQYLLTHNTIQRIVLFCQLFFTCFDDFTQNIFKVIFPFSENPGFSFLSRSFFLFFLLFFNLCVPRLSRAEIRHEQKARQLEKPSLPRFLFFKTLSRIRFFNISVGTMDDICSCISIPVTVFRYSIPFGFCSLKY